MKKCFQRGHEFLFRGYRRLDELMGWLVQQQCHLIQEKYLV